MAIFANGKRSHREITANFEQIIKYVMWQDIKISNETQTPHNFFFTLLVMLGNYEP